MELHSRVGARRGADVLAFIVAWDTARRSLGDEWPATITEQVQAYAEWWRASERTSWRELERYRAAFPEFPDPADLIAAAEPVWNRRRGALGLGSAVLPA